MSCNYTNSTAEFQQYMQSIVKLEELQKMTEDLNKQLEDSQKAMLEIKTIFNNIPNVQNNVPQQQQQNNAPQQQNNVLRHEDISQFLEAGVPKLLMPDMPVNTMDVDVDNVIATMKSYAEDLRKIFVVPNPQQQQQNREINNLNLEQYASSLDQLTKRLVNLKLNKNGEASNKSQDLEDKLALLCQDVNMFTQMVQAKAKLSESNKNWTPTTQDNTALQYDNLINKLLLDINELTYLLKN